MFLNIRANTSDLMGPSVTDPRGEGSIKPTYAGRDSIGRF